ncbi:1-phosphofructokinase family hexose kinase [Williamsia deligens]|uniref:1-phosphofructokinase family hexose kinase n=1 Tax=Williamsia deligens TaxID=321325 RepID=A0ABW3GDT4_9NOCA|nr:1-phosphofructokinase family hexose kinase [Williamsia deligens]MCP2195428.1 1-phosphofructokinase [Williamsia deligens]
MIVTVTANPSLDRTIVLPGPLDRGAVVRAIGARSEPGGKGINVSRVAQVAGVPTVALLPAPSGDPLLVALDAVGLHYRTVATADEVRSNITVTEPDGTTTKLNLPGTTLDAGQIDAFAALILAASAGAEWVALCGSLPPGVPADFYRQVAASLAGSGCRVAVDTSGAPLAALLPAVADGSVHLIKPNTEELCEITGGDVAHLDGSAAAGDFSPTLEAARSVIGSGDCVVLATLGAAGAMVVTADGAWQATPPPITPVSTVGAGDATLAGYLLASIAGAAPAEALRAAVAHGSAAAALPGTQPPRPGDLAPHAVRVSEVSTPFV